MNKKLLSAIILGAGLIASSIVFAQVTSTSGAAKAPTGAELNAAAKGITFPIPELGNCTDRESCRTYCYDVNNMAACVSYAQAHGLANQKEADLARKYINLVKNKETPGGCTDPASCNQYCQSVSHLSECLEFAKKSGISGDNIEEGQQVVSYLNSGGKTPGGCDTKDACEQYCSDFSHAKECAAFAKNAGMVKRLAREQGIPEGQFQKVLDLTAAGQTPGQCKSKEQCEKYCKDGLNLNECMDFSVKAGFVSADKAEIIKKLGGKGPGGCDSEDACKNYCNDPVHSTECFNFAKDNGLMSSEDLKKAQEGIVQLKMGLEQAPPEMKACLTSVLGPDAVAGVQNGTFVPSQDIGDKLEQCNEKFQENIDPEEMFKGAPPAVAQCLKDKLGGAAAKISSGQVEPDATSADAFRACMGQMQIMQGGAAGQAPNFEGMMKGAPQEIQSCIKEKLGSDFAEKVAKGEANPEDIQGKMKDCFSNFRPGMMQGERRESSESRNGYSGPATPPGAPNRMPSIPPELLDCVKSKLNAEEFANLSGGKLSSDAEGALQSCARAQYGTGAPFGGVPAGMMPQGSQQGGGGSSTGGNPLLPGNPLNPASGSGQSSGGYAPPAMIPPTGSISPTGVAPQINCSSFAAVPSCSYIPAGPAQDACNKCKNQ